MFKKNSNEKIDIGKINDTVSLFNKILRIGFLLIVVVAIYALTLILKEWKVIVLIKNILKILTPFFIGIVVAWLFNPIVSFLQKKKINRILGTVLVYIVFIGVLYFFVYNIIPLIASQTKDLANSIPSITESITNKITKYFGTLESNDLIDYNRVKIQIIDSLNKVGGNIVSNLPITLMNILKSFVSALGSFGIGLIIGFYML